MANFATLGFSRLAASASSFAAARHHIKATFRTIDRQTEMDINKGEVPAEPFQGNIEFRDVKFRYPNRNDVCVLRVSTDGGIIGLTLLVQAS